MFDLAELGPQHFDDLIGTRFAIADSELALTLRAVERYRSPSPRGPAFSLTFAAPANTRGTQGTYRLIHPRLGELAIFLVPIAPVDGVPQFEAVFN
ncbi:MAG: hypothetical protein WAR01_03615 [Dokdonella sp.]|uniref:DUF6916 family protein n=1 Tax=Dokdonella sp. TaxID=2291710 RepID=UPI003BB14E7C